MRKNGQNSAQGKKSIIGLPGGHSRITPEWLGLRRLSEYADVSERTLRVWIHSPVEPLPAVRIGGKILVRRADFDAWLQRHKIEPLATDNVDAIVREVVEGVTVER